MINSENKKQPSGIDIFKKYEKDTSFILACKEVRIELEKIIQQIPKSEKDLEKIIQQIPEKNLKNIINKYEAGFFSDPTLYGESDNIYYKIFESFLTKEVLKNIIKIILSENINAKID